MLDIKFVRENPEIVKQNIRNKFQDNKLELVDKVIELDKENREIKQEVEALRAERNKTSKQIGALMAQGKRDEAEEVKKQCGLWPWKRGGYAVLLCRERHLQTCFRRYRGGTGSQWKSCFHRKSQSYAHISGSYGG